MNKINYQKISDEIINENQKQGRVPSLLLQSCCAPCSSYVLEYLSRFFSITVLYYNPNIFPAQEFEKRAAEQERLIRSMKLPMEVQFLAGEYESDVFFEMAAGLEDCPEGGRRCALCYELRLRKTAALAKEKGFDYFTTTLTISPLKNAAVINEIGARLSAEYGVPYFFSDFKKKEGYKRSIELSKEFDLYRQNYCGCIFSKDVTE